ncbi:uncharacterized protein [Macrobrachium rosenbergii]|uniref:uncharacterized protein isoform X1 n=2 Tax=Macrobrachium rosenbergii TaxID=79674 RepID=UPI0034D59C9E
MDLLTKAAQSVFNADNDEELCVPLTPTKDVQYTPPRGERAALAELTNTINISPEKFNNSPLQALFNAPTLCTPKTKTRNLNSIINSNGSRNVGRSSGGKSVSSPTPGIEVGTPKQSGASPGLPKSGGSKRSPLTPMTNLKLLTRVASMEESLSTSSKKVLFEKENKNQEVSSSKIVSSHISGMLRRRYNSECLRQSENGLPKEAKGMLRKHPTSDNYPPPSSPGNLVLEGIGQISSVDDSITARPPEVSRKDKSLGLLSEKFLEQFPLEVSFLETPRRLVIDEVASLLGTERRRVYDIINVLESLNMATRVQKNMYQWTGRLHLEETLGRLKALGEKYDIATQLQALKNEDSNEFKVPQQIKLTKPGDAERTDIRKENSLSILCQKFLMILLVSPQPHIISLDNAIRLLVGEAGESGDRLRARGRRLYDIANVLTSLGLVRRIPAAKAFQYIGPVVDPIVNDDDTFGILQRNSLLPSRRVVSSECKENINNYGDHEVTPSDVAPPVQKRGRPRKLATAFTTSTLPAPKRSRLQRTRSEDVISNTRKLTRNPSLHEICQVAEVEREKLLKEQQSCRSQSSDGFESGCERPKRVFSFDENVVLPNSDFRPISSAWSSSILQCRLAKRAKIPIALTFQNAEDYGPEGERHLNPQFVSKTRDNAVKSLNSKIASMQKSNNTVACLHPKPVKGTMDIKRDSSGSSRMSLVERCPTITVSQPQNAVQWPSSQSYKNQAQTKSPVIIVKGGAVGPKSFSHSRVVPVSDSISQGTQVIKVITKTSASKEQDASTVMTVLPANPSGKPFTVQPKQIRNTSGCFQQVSEGMYTNSQKITVSSSSSLLGPDGSSIRRNSTEGKTPSSFVVFTVSDNQAGQRTLSKLPKGDGFSVSLHKPSGADNVNQAKVGEHFSSGISSLTSAPLQLTRKVEQESSVNEDSKSRQQPATLVNRNNFSGGTSWQPSPDGSSTDSELEQIFGDPFSFARPKALVPSNVKSQSLNDKLMTSYDRDLWAMHNGTACAQEPSGLCSISTSVLDNTADLCNFACGESFLGSSFYVSTVVYSRPYINTSTRLTYSHQRPLLFHLSYWDLMYGFQTQFSDA